VSKLDPRRHVQHVVRGSRVPRWPAVSIIVLVTDRTDRVRRCLDSIAANAAGGPSAELIVLANGTPTNALASLTSRDDILLVRSAVNHGFGGGCNWAVRFASGQRFVFVNDDATVTPGWLAALDGTMDDDGRIAVVGSRVLLADGRVQEAGDVIWRDGSTSHVGRGLPADEPALLTRRDVDYVSFCSAMVRREAWDDVGGFDERYFPAYYEDADLCMTARAKGWRVVCEPASVVVHEEGGSTPVPLRHFLSHRNQQIFVDKWKTTLAQFDERPARNTSRAVMAASLGHTRATDARRPAAAPQRVRRRTSRQRDVVDEPEALAVELRHLADDVALKEEYIAFLGAELSEYGAADVARRRYRALRRGLGRQVRRHPRLLGAVEALRARIAERTSQ
jgi:GT2 family glycosyltransferase